MGKSIPPDAVPEVEALLGLNEDEKGAVLEAIRAAKLTMNPGRLVQDLSSILPEKKAAQGVVRSLKNLYLAYDDSEGSMDEVESLVMDAKISPDLFAESKEWLEACLQTEQICVLAKANRLQLETPHALQEARIVTDVRPIFHGAVDDGPRANLIVHQLTMYYHTLGHKYDAFQITFDDEDLRSMAQMIERALAKSAKLAADSQVPAMRDST